MTLTIFAGDIADAVADAVCTSTNPRLSLMMGTGAAIRARGGFSILRACEAIVAKEGHLRAGSVHATTAGDLPHKLVVHCVASDESHRSSPQIITACVRNAIACARAAGCHSIAMPVFGTGHARVRFDVALRAMLEALHGIDAVIVVNDLERAEQASAILRVPLIRSASVDEPASSFWDSE
jgi:O-acetyl-ADP-ribose deacetylase (regulator of RNase III)